MCKRPRLIVRAQAPDSQASYPCTMIGQVVNLKGLRVCLGRQQLQPNATRLSAGHARDGSLMHGVFGTLPARRPSSEDKAAILQVQVAGRSGFSRLNDRERRWAE